MACLCVGFSHGARVSAQTVTTSTAVQRLVGGVLQTSSTTVNAGDVVAFPWLPNASTVISAGVPPTATMTFTVNTATLPAGASNFQWSVAGDIGFTTGSNTTSTSVTVGTFNKSQRTTSGGSAIPSDLGQSKGRLTLSYSFTPVGTGGPCTGVVSSGSFRIDLLKKFSGTSAPSIPQIVGPVCLLPNTDYTYSVDPIVTDNIIAEIGVDKYTWDVAAAIVNGGSIQYGSIDNSSITIRTGNPVPSTAQIKCYFGEVNSPPTQTTVASQAYAFKDLLTGAGTPVVTLSGSASSGALPLSILPSTNFNLPSSCVPTVTGGAGALIFTVTQQPGATYQWEFGTYGSTANGWNTAVAQTILPFTANGITFTVANIFNQPGTVTLKVTSNCGSVTNYVYTINRKLTVASAGIITLSSNCTPQGTAVTATLLATGNGAANLNNVTWSSATNPVNWGFTGGAGSFTLTPNISTPVGVYSLTPNFNGCAAAVPYTVNVRPSAVTLSSPTTLCIPRPATNFAATFLPTGTTQYSYTLTGTGNSVTTPSGTTNIASINRTGTALAGTITATYTVAAGCITSSTAQNILTPAVVPSSITLPTCIGSGATGTNALITIGSHPGVGTYSLTFVSGTNIISSTGPFTPNGSNQITVPINPAATGSGTYTMAHTVTNCSTSGASASFILDNATGAPNFAAIITQGANKLLIPSEAATWTYYNCTSGSALTTNASNPSNPISLATNPSATWLLTVASPGATNQFGFQGTAANGCVYRSCTLVNNYSNRPGKGQSDAEIERKLLLPPHVGKIYPNPNDGNFAIEIEEADKPGHAGIIDLSGKEVAHFEVKKGKNEIVDLKLATGNYTVIIWLDGKVYANKIIVNQK